MGSKSDLEGDQYMGALRRQALGVLAYWTNWMEDFDMTGTQVMELRIQSPRKTGGDFRVVCKAVTEDGRLLVAFGNGSDVQSALMDLKTRQEMRGINWKDDKPWAPEGAQ